MRMVQFPLVLNGNQVVYPDDVALFRNAMLVSGTIIVAEYYGVLPLDDYGAPWPDPPGHIPGSVIEQPYGASTLDATPTTIIDYPLPDYMTGYVRIIVVGSNANSVKSVVYVFDAGAKNDGSVSTLLSAENFTVVRAFNPNAIATPPAATLDGDDIQVVVTGVDGEAWTWMAYMMLVSCK